MSTVRVIRPTLADFAIPIPLYCFHCEKRLPKSATVDKQEASDVVLVDCPKCGLMTPFTLEAA
jgi:transcription elongation factor Elf1